MFTIAGAWALLANPMVRYGLVALGAMLALGWYGEVRESRGESRERAKWEAAAAAAKAQGVAVDAGAETDARNERDEIVSKLNAELKIERERRLKYEADLKAAGRVCAVEDPDLDFDRGKRRGMPKPNSRRPAS